MNDEQAGRDELGTQPLAVVGFDDWYRQTWPRLVRALTVFCRNEDLARDIAAESCTRAYSRWDTRDGLDHPTAWTFAVGFNLARRQGQRRRRESEHAVNAAGVVAQAQERDLDLWNAVACLSPRAREITVLRYVADLRDRDIAEIMGIAEGTVAATLTRARRELAAALEGGNPK